MLKILLIALVACFLIALVSLVYYGVAIAGMREAGVSERTIKKVLRWRQ